ncbi:DNA repair protein RecO [Chroococcidiopsis sp. TS-821]|uniref:DNA repair protein RecO n=1 Tax=Chroococcidiopsis sp. TS-821 TaxID=1378066 RepID=UPI000CEE4C41|nr:DNA repair protein RecO [Chroococcidiopsis sp. TS-821]PPS45201.1 DNA repair protein RecO [Chroococcidiopsis sp. TS-821]
MSRTYKATGINLKSMALGESDRLLTILTREFGLVRAVAPGSRKHNSSLSGRSGLFVVNDLLIAKGRSLDKITQAQTKESYPGLSQDLGKLAASQYLAEMALYQALSEQPQEELFSLLSEHLGRLERLPKNQPRWIIAYLSHAVFHLLAIAGIAPQVQRCCLSGILLQPDLSNSHWQVGFSAAAGGIVSLDALERLQAQGRSFRAGGGIYNHQTPPQVKRVAEPAQSYQAIAHRQEIPALISRIDATELEILQKLSQAELDQLTPLAGDNIVTEGSWIFIEQILRQYAQYHFGRPIRSAALIDSYFALPTSIS